MKNYDPRPMSRRADLAAKKNEFDADTASINKRTQQMNANAERQYAQRMAAQSKPKPTEKKDRGWLASAVSGMRRRITG